MRYLRNIFSVVSCLFLISCEKVITVPIKDAAPQYVINGYITDSENSCRVLIYTTVGFNDTNFETGVSGAIVTVAENDKSPVRLEEVERGLYRANLTGKSGNTYSLRVELDGKIYTATSTMPRKVNIDTLYITERPFLGKTRKFATVEFTDPPQSGNAYRFIQYVNGEPEATVFVTNDTLINGRRVKYDLLVFNDEYTLYKCDQVYVVMQSIDYSNYLFWNSLNQSALGAPQTASPANPLSNIKGGALGHFSAHTISSYNVAVFPDSTCSYPESSLRPELKVWE